MMTFQSLLHNVNLKQLVHTLKVSQQRSPLPFYVLKIKQRTPIVPEHSSLSLSQKITDETLSTFNGPLTVWSPHHLHRIAETRGQKPSNRLILKNPYKSEQLIIQSLAMGVSEMVIDSREQFNKIQDLKAQSSRFKNKEITYLWQTQDHPENIKELLQLKGKVQGLFFPKDQTTLLPRVEQMTKDIMEKGLRLQHIICEGKIANIQALLEWQKQSLLLQGQTVKKVVDVSDASEVELCVLATKLPNKRLIVNEEARTLIKGLDHSSTSLLVQYENEQWFLSSIQALPLDQEKYIFNVEKTDDINDLNAPKAFAF